MASINAVLTAENGDDLYPETYDDYVLDSNGEALSTRLGSRSEASGVSGTTAFGKINTLSSELTPDLLTSPFTWDNTKVSVNSNATYVYRMGKIVFMSFDVDTLAGISGNAVDIGTISIMPPKTIYGMAYNWGSKKANAIRITSGDGNIRIYDAVASTEYTAFLAFITT